MTLSTGGPGDVSGEGYSSTAVTWGMKNYQIAKDGMQQAGSDTEQYLKCAADKMYWEIYTLAAGAMSIECCAIPFGFAGTPQDEYWVEQRAEYQRKLLLLEVNTELPNATPKGTPPTDFFNKVE